MIARFGAVYAAIAVIIAAALGFFGGFLWIVNAISAAIGSFLVAIASFAAQRKIVLEAVKNSDGVLDTIDDKEKLYDEDTPQEQNEQTQDDPKTPLKTKAFYAMRSFSLSRIFAYAVFVLGFFALYSGGAFAPAPFLIGLATLPISALIFAAIGTQIAKKREK
ncbi:MAG: hypothetical protein LBQ52_06050 [Helicobacteraceae bacterium]|nr:hypothetical protein [Helicobacteraceae bacterium]